MQAGTGRYLSTVPNCNSFSRNPIRYEFNFEGNLKGLLGVCLTETTSTLCQHQFCPEIKSQRSQSAEIVLTGILLRCMAQ